jgi:nucleoid-associated protein YgaU
LEFNLKKILKTIKLNENSISMGLGALVIVITGILVVNYFNDKNGETLPDLSTESGNIKEHIVSEGETLWSIAEDSYGSGYSWVEIAEANDLESEMIEEGQVLVIPEITTEEEVAKTIEAEETKSPETDTYTVVTGDSLWEISVNTYGDGYRWVEIAKANGLTNPDVIHAGNVLTLPK